MLRSVTVDGHEIRVFPGRLRARGVVEAATLHLSLRPGTDIALLNGLAHVLIGNGWVDRSFVEARTEDFEAFAASVRDTTPEYLLFATSILSGLTLVPLGYAVSWPGACSRRPPV
jgi:ferredoxin-nitrate reductase